MSEDNLSNNQPPLPSDPSRPRRASIAELFRPDQSSATATKPSSLSTAMAQAQQQSRTRRLSITALGLSASPTRGQPPSPFGSIRDRGKSISDTSGAGFDDNETAIAEDGEPASLGTNGLGPIGRRMSAGAKAYSEGMRRSSGNSNSSNNNGSSSGIQPLSSSASRVAGSPPSASKSKFAEGFNWGESLRSRAERQSMSGTSGAGYGIGHMRSPSQAEPQINPTPPAPKPVQTKPDHFQERILKGDFYMD